MTEIQVIFQSGNTERTIGVSPNQTIGDFREAAQMLLGLPEKPPCKVVLERTEETLRDSLNFGDVEIKQNDKIILISPTPIIPTTLITSPLKSQDTPETISKEIPDSPISPDDNTPIPEPPTKDANSGLKDLHKPIITSSIILGIFVLAGLALSKYLPSFSTLPPQSTQTSYPTPDVTPNLTQPTPVPTTFAPSIPPISPPSPTSFPPPRQQPSTSNNTNATIVGQPGKKNIRRGPGLEYAPRHIAYPGDRVQVIKSVRNSDKFIWYHIYFPQSGADGWIAGNLLAVDGQTTYPSQPQIQPPSQPPPKASSRGTNATVSGTPGTKNMRSGAGTAYGVVGTVRTGDRLQILGSSYDRGGYQWYKVYHPQSGTTGWIAAQLISSD